MHGALTYGLFVVLKLNFKAEYFLTQVTFKCFTWLFLAKMRRRHVLSTVAARDDPTTFLDGRCGERWVRWWPSLPCFLVFWLDSCNHCKYQNDNNRDDLVGQLTMLTWQCTWHSSWLGFQDLQLDTSLEASHWKKSVCIARHCPPKQVTEVYETFNLASYTFGLQGILYCFWEKWIFERIEAIWQQYY